MLEPVMVDAYGAMTPINQVGTVNVPEPRMVTINVWDKSLVGKVEKAIRESGLGINPQLNGTIIMLPIPELNEERRRELTKVAAQYAEQRPRGGAQRPPRRDGPDQEGQGRGHVRGRPEILGSRGAGADRQPYRRSMRRWRPSKRNHAGLTASGGAPAWSRRGPDEGHVRNRGPRHVAIIMDGNGRWAQARGRPRLFGHHAGAKRVREIVEACPDLGVAT
jgi:hypothetical protein